jgi:hypothetical protein
MGHVTTLEPSLTWWWGPESWDAWQHQNPPQHGGGVQCRGTRGSAEAHLNREKGSDAVGRIAMLEPTSIGRRGLELRDTWWLVVACSAACPVFVPVCGGTRSIGYRQPLKYIHWLLVLKLFEEICTNAFHSPSAPNISPLCYLSTTNSTILQIQYCS